MGFKVRRKKGNVKVKNAVPNEHDGIKFRSRLETYIYKKLKENGIDADYEKHKFVLLQSFDFHDEKIREWTYTPDFVSPKFILEAKGWGNDVWPVKCKMFKAYLVGKGDKRPFFVVANQKEVLEAIEAIKKLK